MANIEMIRPYVEKKVAEYLGADSVKTNPDGSIPIRFGSTACIVNLVEGPSGPMMRVFSPFIQEVEKTPELLEKLNQLNSTAPYVRFFWLEQSVYCSVDVIATDLETGEIANALSAVAWHADNFDEQLVKEFGGKRVFEEEPPKDEKAPEAGTGQYL